MTSDRQKQHTDGRFPNPWEDTHKHWLMDKYKYESRHWVKIDGSVKRCVQLTDSGERWQKDMDWYIEGHAMSYYSCLLRDRSLSFSSWHHFREMRKRGKLDTSYYFLALLTGGRVKAAHPSGSLQLQSWSIWHVTWLACSRPRLETQIY